MRPWMDALNELFGSRAPVSWDASEDRYAARFSVSDMDFEVEFARSFPDKNEWGVIFELSALDASLHGVYQMGNTGLLGPSSVHVMGNVVAIVRAFVAKIDPDVIEFSGEDGKDQLYARMIRHLSREIEKVGYETTSRGSRGVVHFAMHKRGYPYDIRNSWG